MRCFTVGVRREFWVWSAISAFCRGQLFFSSRFDMNMLTFPVSPFSAVIKRPQLHVAIVDNLRLLTRRLVTHELTL
jgi:hypothetical protein